MIHVWLKLSIGMTLKPPVSILRGIGLFNLRVFALTSI